MGRALGVPQSGSAGGSRSPETVPRVPTVPRNGSPSILVSLYPVLLCVSFVGPLFTFASSLKS